MADLERGDGFGRVDSEALQPYGMAECPLGLAFAQASVYQPVEQSQVPVALDRYPLAVLRVKLDDVPAFVQGLSSGRGRKYAGQGLREASQPGVFRIDCQFHYKMTWALCRPNGCRPCPESVSAARL